MTTPSVSTAEPPSDPPSAGEGDGAGASGHRRRRRWVWIGAGLASLAVVVGILFIPTPYYLFQPGSVRPAETRIDVEGAPSFETDGDVLFTTVFVDQASVALLVRGWLDDAVDIKSERDVYGPEGKDASRQANQQRMDMSKLIATKVALQYLGYPAEFTGKGAKVLGVDEEGGSVGKLRVGDVIVEVDGHQIHLPSDIQTALSGKVPGDVVEVTANRGGSDGSDSDGSGSDGGSASGGGSGRDEPETVTESITLGSAPVAATATTTTTPTSAPTTSTAPDTAAAANAPDPSETATTPTTTLEETPTVRPVLGISVEPADPSVESPVKVTVDSGDVTGPSAGLAWALAVVDRMTPESLTDGKDVAVTGEILADGSVGEIGGILQKVAAVKRSGVKTFLYPAETPEDAQRQMGAIAGDAVKLVPVASLNEAVEALHPGGVRPPS